jgi:hypothetical protein
MRHQAKLKQPRYRLQAKTINKLVDCIERDSIRWNCSKSWIIATALAAFYGIDIAKPYEADKLKKSEAVKSSKVLINFKRRA